MNNIITIRSVYKITRCIMEPAPDAVTGRLAKSVRRVDSNGDMILTAEDKKDAGMNYLIAENDVIEIFDGKTFDLNDPFDNAWWEAIRGSRRIASDRGLKDNQGNYIIDGNANRYGSAEFYVEYPGKESNARVTNKRKINQAHSFILNDSSEGLYTKVKLLGSRMDGVSLDDVTDYLLSVADKQPDKIIDLYTDSDISYLILITDAVERGVIKKINNIYIYADTNVLGASQESVMAWMKLPKNVHLLDLIKSETYPTVYEKPVVSDIEDLQAETIEDDTKAKTVRTRSNK